MDLKGVSLSIYAEDMADTESLLARFAAPVASTPTRLAVLSDLHLSPDGQGTWRVSHQTADRLRATVESLNQEQDLDGVFFLGDLVQSGTHEEYEAFDRIIEGLEVPFFAIPGNHDLIGNDSLPLSEFERRYTPGELPYRKRIGGIDLLALNSNRSTRESVADSFIGRLEPETLEWLSDQLATAEQPLVAVHHNLPGTRSILFDSDDSLPVAASSPGFENADELVEVLNDGGAPLVLTGHVHFPAVARMGAVREFTLPSLGPYPNVYTVLDIDERGTTATMHSVVNYEDRLESFVLGRDNCRVQLAAAQMTALPLLDELSDPSIVPQYEREQ